MKHNRVVIFVLIFLSNNLFAQTLDKVSLEDTDVMMVLDNYLKRLPKQVGDEKFEYHLRVQVVSNGSNKIMCLSPIVYIGRLLEDYPVSYSVYKNHIIFWYSEGYQESPVYSFYDVFNQFNGRLIKDVDRNGNSYLESELELLTINFKNFETLRYIVKSGRIRDVQEITSFPNNYFYQAGYQFDENGRVKYSDGSFDEDEIDRPFLFFEEDNLDYGGFADFVIRNSDLNYNLFRENSVSGIITIDENGQIIKAEIIVNRGNLTDEQINTIKNTILFVKVMKSPTINGEKVCFKSHIGF